jgi:hypothetical protein
MMMNQTMSQNDMAHSSAAGLLNTRSLGLRSRPRLTPPG